MNEILTDILIIFYIPVLIIWIGSFIAGFFLHNLYDSTSLKYESYKSIIESKFFGTHIQCSLYYSAQLLIIFLVYPVKISNWITWKLKFN